MFFSFPFFFFSPRISFCFIIYHSSVFILCLLFSLLLFFYFFFIGYYHLVIFNHWFIQISIHLVSPRLTSSLSRIASLVPFLIPCPVLSCLYTVYIYIIYILYKPGLRITRCVRVDWDVMSPLCSRGFAHALGIVWSFCSVSASLCSLMLSLSARSLLSYALLCSLMPSLCLHGYAEAFNLVYSPLLTMLLDYIGTFIAHWLVFVWCLLLYLIMNDKQSHNNLCLLWDHMVPKLRDIMTSLHTSIETLDQGCQLRIKKFWYFCLDPYPFFFLGRHETAAGIGWISWTSS